MSPSQPTLRFLRVVARFFIVVNLWYIQDFYANVAVIFVSDLHEVVFGEHRYRPNERVAGSEIFEHVAVVVAAGAPIAPGFSLL